MYLKVSSSKLGYKYSDIRKYKMQEIHPTEIKFIKLGEGGEWEKECIEGPYPSIRLGYRSDQHQLCLSKNWSPVDDYWLKAREGKRAVATATMSQIKDFYEKDENTLWFTFYKGRLWWCFAETAVHELDDKSRVRNTISGWSSCDINSKPLTIETLDGRLSMVRGFRGTICNIKADVKRYLLDRINGRESVEVQLTREALNSLEKATENLIQGLWWKDFELLVELIFSQSGWQRLSINGGTEKDIDLTLNNPVTGNKAFVQVKSTATVSSLDSYVSTYESMPDYDEFYFVVHSFDMTTVNCSKYAKHKNIHILDRSKLARLVVNVGLTKWLIDKRS